VPYCLAIASTKPSTRMQKYVQQPNNGIFFWHSCWNDVYFCIFYKCQCNL